MNPTLIGSIPDVVCRNSDHDNDDIHFIDW